MTYAPLDIVLAVFIVILAVRAALHGLVDEALGWAWLVFGALGAILFYDTGAVFLREKLPRVADIKYAPEALAFILIFAIVFIVVKIVSAILSDIVDRTRLGGFNRLLGFLFGIAEGVLLSAFVVFIIIHQPLFDKEPVLRNSFAGRIFTPRLEQVEKIVEKSDII